MYDVDGPLGFGVRRATYLINQDRKIQAAVLADFKIERHKEFIENAVELRETAKPTGPGNAYPLSEEARAPVHATLRSAS